MHTCTFEFHLITIILLSETSPVKLPNKQGMYTTLSKQAAADCYEVYISFSVCVCVCACVFVSVCVSH